MALLSLKWIELIFTKYVFKWKGGAITPIGDPPNIIVASNPTIVANVRAGQIINNCFFHLFDTSNIHLGFYLFQGVDFLTFSTHMAAGIVLVMIQTYIHLRYKFRDMTGLRSEEPQAAQLLRQEIKDWEHAAQSLSSTSDDASLVRDRLENKITQLKRQLKKQLSTGKISTEIYRETLRELEEKVIHRNSLACLKMVKFSYLLLIVIFFSLLNSIQFEIESY